MFVCESGFYNSNNDFCGCTKVNQSDIESKVRAKRVFCGFEVGGSGFGVSEVRNA